MFNKTNSSSTTPTDSKKKASPSKVTQSAGIPSILGKDIVITGDIKTDGDVQIDGRIEGNIIANHVMIGEHGAVNGKISAVKATIQGKVTGKIDASTVELSETANVQADIIQDHIVIANGAFLDGKCTRKSSTNIAKPILK
ncbi:MAG: polymer-forming cytoskeletal protein [Maricaulaceae bacterium]